MAWASLGMLERERYNPCFEGLESEPSASLASAQHIRLFVLCEALFLLFSSLFLLFHSFFF